MSTIFFLVHLWQIQSVTVYTFKSEGEQTVITNIPDISGAHHIEVDFSQKVCVTSKRMEAIGNTPSLEAAFFSQSPWNSEHLHLLVSLEKHM